MIVAWYCGLAEEGTTMRVSMGVDGVNGSFQWGDKAQTQAQRHTRHEYRHRHTGTTDPGTTVSSKWVGEE